MNFISSKEYIDLKLLDQLINKFETTINLAHPRDAMHLIQENPMGQKLRDRIKHPRTH